LVSSDNLEGQQMGKWEVILALFIVGLLKFVLIIICGTLPIASGLFSPSVMLGAHIGRMIGEILDALFPTLINYPAGFALVGMTAFPCAVTSTFSPAVITVETIGSLDYLVPCLLVSVISYSIGEMVNGSIYNVMIRFRKMPFLSANLSPKYICK
jgi:H+/Cl- antiporter ClcA